MMTAAVRRTPSILPPAVAAVMLLSACNTSTEAAPDRDERSPPPEQATTAEPVPEPEPEPEPTPTAINPCELITPEEARELNRAVGDTAEPLSPTGRSVSVDETFVELCWFGSAMGRSDGQLSMFFDATPPVPTPAPFDDLGDQMYFETERSGRYVSYFLGAPYGPVTFELRMAPPAPDEASADEAAATAEAAMADLLRQVWDRLPGGTVVPEGDIASGPCAELTEAASAAVDWTVNYSRTFTLGNEVLCSFVTAAGRSVAVHYRTDQHEARQQPLPDGSAEIEEIDDAWLLPTGSIITRPEEEDGLTILVIFDHTGQVDQEREPADPDADYSVEIAVATEVFAVFLD